MVSAGGGVNNAIKSIMTRSGHTLEFNDGENGTHILIKDPSGNTIRLDTKGKNIEITAPETITLTAKNININANKNISMNAGADMEATAGGNVSQTAGGEMVHAATADYTLQAANIKKVATGKIITHADAIQRTAKRNIQHESESNITINAKNDINHQSGENTLTS